MISSCIRSRFTSNDITISGTTAKASMATISGSGNEYIVNVSGMQNDGTVIIDIGDNVCSDEAGNPNVEASIVKNTVIYDTEKPSVSIDLADGQAEITNTSPLSYKISFSESVTGFDSDDITISGTANASTSTVTGSGSEYIVTISDIQNSGTVIINIDANVCSDEAGN